MHAGPVRLQTNAAGKGSCHLCGRRVDTGTAVCLLQMASLQSAVLRSGAETRCSRWRRSRSSFTSMHTASTCCRVSNGSARLLWSIATSRTRCRKITSAACWLLVGSCSAATLVPAVTLPLQCPSCHSNACRPPVPCGGPPGICHPAVSPACLPP